MEIPTPNQPLLSEEESKYDLNQMLGILKETKMPYLRTFKRAIFDIKSDFWSLTLICCYLGLRAQLLKISDGV